MWHMDMYVLGEGHYLLCMFLLEGGTWAELSHGVAPSAYVGDPSAGESGVIVKLAVTILSHMQGVG